MTKAKKKGEDEEETHPTPELTYTGNTDASDAGARRKGVSFLLLEMDGRKKREKGVSFFKLLEIIAFFHTFDQIYQRELRRRILCVGPLHF